MPSAALVTSSISARSGGRRKFCGAPCVWPSISAVR
jgi:hypothetical protein